MDTLRLAVARKLRETQELAADRTFPPFEEWAAEWLAQADQVLAAVSGELIPHMRANGADEWTTALVEEALSR